MSEPIHQYNQQFHSSLHPAVRVHPDPIHHQTDQVITQSDWLEPVFESLAERSKRLSAARIRTLKQDHVQDQDNDPPYTPTKSARSRHSAKGKKGKKKTAIIIPATHSNTHPTNNSIPSASIPNNQTNTAEAIYLPQPLSDITNLLPAPEGSILDVHNLLILHPPRKSLNPSQISTLKSPFQQYTRDNADDEEYTSPFEMYTCRVCSKTYDGRNARSVARRHLQDKHGLSLGNQPRRSRWDGVPQRPKSKKEAEQRTLNAKKQWAMRNRHRARLEKTYATYLEPFGPKGLSTPQGIQLIAPIFRTNQKPTKRGIRYQNGVLGNVIIPTDMMQDLDHLLGIIESSQNGPIVDRSSSALLDENEDVAGGLEFDFELEGGTEEQGSETPISNDRSTRETRPRRTSTKPPTFNEYQLRHDPQTLFQGTMNESQAQNETFILRPSTPSKPDVVAIHRPALGPDQWTIEPKSGRLIDMELIKDAVLAEKERLQSTGTWVDEMEKKLYFALVPVSEPVDQPLFSQDTIQERIEGEESNQQQRLEITKEDMLKQLDILSSNQTWVPPHSTGNLLDQIRDIPTCEPEFEDVEGWYSSLASLGTHIDDHEVVDGDQSINTNGDEEGQVEVAVAVESLLDLHSSPLRIRESQGKVELSDQAVNDDIQYGSKSNEDVEEEIEAWYKRTYSDAQTTPSRKPHPGLKRSATASNNSVTRPDKIFRTMSTGHLGCLPQIDTPPRDLYPLPAVFQHSFKPDDKFPLNLPSTEMNITSSNENIDPDTTMENDKILAESSWNIPSKFKTPLRKPSEQSRAPIPNSVDTEENANRLSDQWLIFSSPAVPSPVRSIRRSTRKSLGGKGLEASPLPRS